MDVTANLSLGDPLEPARKATAEMLQNRERTFSLPQPFYNDERLFEIDMQEIFQKEWLIAGMTCEIPAKGNFLTLQVGKNPIIVIRGAEGQVHAFHNVCRHRGSRLCTSEKARSPNWCVITTSGPMSWTGACCLPAPRWVRTST